jgi:periplasmic copper chaperone A
MDGPLVTHLFRRARRRAPVLLVAVVALMLVAPAAWAHVTVSSPDATPGGFGKLVFNVPTESATASTVRLTVALPAATPFAEVSAKSFPGWSVATTERHLAKPITNDDGFNLTKAVATVTWTAASGQGVAPGQFQEFELSVGPFPKGAAAIALPTVQTYSDGTIVRWIEPTPASGDEPEHPAPMLALPAATASNPVRAAAETTSAASGDDTDGLARWLGGVGLALGVAALATAILSTRRRTA